MSPMRAAIGSGRSIWSDPGRFLLLLGLCFGTMPSALAQGGPPMLTDDPATPGSGRLEINTAYLERRSQTDRLRSFPHVDFNFGLGDNIQFKYETGWVFASPPDGGATRSGLDDSLHG